jgi:predicted transcriptional regulator
MVNTEMLEKAIKDAGFTVTDFAKSVDISRASFYLKKDNKRDFTSKEICRICDKLGLDIFQKDKIFFANLVA